MPKRCPNNPNPNQAAIDFNALPPEPEPEPTATPIVPTSEMDTPDSVSDPAPEYSVTKGWVDLAGKQRTWRLHEPSGTKIAEITTKSGAKRLADLLNRAEGTGRNHPK